MERNEERERESRVGGKEKQQREEGRETKRGRERKRQIEAGREIGIERGQRERMIWKERGEKTAKRSVRKERKRTKFYTFLYGTPR